ncbi:hypothetical protein P154DRAFT_502440 [Amniculicola lignicola CBS 123094]|uniref:BZIP domain-containing protein n=1 Tax=Amniculicola lignicola CBS 123094 TaxID=1392246 RepID=A0A6A5VX00_9PLEO|nr:hypothetical protein P154DRAFT_502440 [Amniculicola lignicola CBS 123094]
MGRNPADHQETKNERASRVRDNKRRHRARQKEYIADLERRGEETRERGVQVTKEVQLAAQKVLRENGKLRDLLRRTGYTDHAIDVWVREDRCLQSTERHQLALESTVEKNVQKVASGGQSQSERNLQTRNVSVEEEELVLGKTSGSRERLMKASLPLQPCKKSELSPTGGTCSATSPPPQYPDNGKAPCKLVTLLVKNPAADITQVTLSPESDKPPSKVSKSGGCISEGIECSAAYKMLMQYATSEEKIDKIAAALESGCTPSAAGGCKVKKSVVWTVLDEECT